MYKETYKKTFITEARTLDPGYIGENDSGWKISGKVHEDYYTWVNDFEAVHKKYGVVKGCFETEVEATSKEALEHFKKHHPVDVWDYYEI